MSSKEPDSGACAASRYALSAVAQDAMGVTAGELGEDPAQAATASTITAVAACQGPRALRRDDSPGSCGHPSGQWHSTDRRRRPVTRMVPGGDDVIGVPVPVMTSSPEVEARSPRAGSGTGRNAQPRRRIAAVGRQSRARRPASHAASQRRPAEVSWHGAASPRPPAAGGFPRVRGSPPQCPPALRRS